MALTQIQAGMFAGNAITAAELSTGAPSWTSGGNLTITGNLITTAKGIGITSLPVGSILQVVSSAQFNGVTTTSTSAQYSSTNPSITPTSSSSKILLLWSPSIIVDTDNDSQGVNNGHVIMGYQIGGTGGAWTTIADASVPGRGGNGTFTNYVYLLSPATTSTVYFRLGIYKDEGARSILINDGWGSNRLFMLEVAA